jgi:hypothetical protein
MGTRTLYVNEQDEAIWNEARSLTGDESGESLSRLVTEGLCTLLADRRAAVEEEADKRRLESGPARAMVADFTKDLRRFGWEEVGRCFTRACIDYGAERSRAKRKADDTLGPEGRKANARKAQETLGVEGRKARARKAQETLGVECRKAAAKKAWNTRKSQG